MARTRIDLGSAQLQVGARLRKLSLLLALALAVSGSSAVAATKKPSPTTTVKATAKTTTKATVTAKPTAKSTSKATVKPSVSATTKSTAKPSAAATSQSTSTSTAKPTVKPKPKPRKSIGVEKSPPPKWPPVGFEYEAGIYAKIPSVEEMTGINSASKYLSNQVKACKKFACGRVLVASESGCLWWEVNSKVYGPNKELIGDLRSIAGSSEAKQLKPIILLTPEPLESLEYVSSIEVVCHQEAKPEGTPSVTFTKVNK